MYFTPYGVGLGHASRSLMVAENLKVQGIESKFSSFGEAARYIIDQGYECLRVPPVEFLWGKDGDFSVKENIIKIPQWLINLPIQINKEIRYLKKIKPSIIISDSRLSSLIAGQILEIPKVVLINQIKLLLTPRLRSFKMGRFFETCNGELMGGFWNLSDIILIPDLPPPYTISEETINSVNSIKTKKKYIGFISPKPKNLKYDPNFLERLGLENTKPLIFVHISGPKETRKPIIGKIIEICKTITHVQFIISEGKTGGDTIPRKINRNIWYFEWCLVRDELFYHSDILIIRGGHAAISQAIKFGKAFISIPIENHGEQLSNSCKIEKLGIGKRLDSRDLNLKSLKNLIDNIINNDEYHKRAMKLMQESEKLNGIENIKDIIFSHI